jgi:hypothetical protein
MIPMLIALYISVLALEKSYEELEAKYNLLKEVMRERQRNATASLAM